MSYSLYIGKNLCDKHCIGTYYILWQYIGIQILLFALNVTAAFFSNFSFLGFNVIYFIHIFYEYLFLIFTYKILFFIL